MSLSDVFISCLFSLTLVFLLFHIFIEKLRETTGSYQILTSSAVGSLMLVMLMKNKCDIYNSKKGTRNCETQIF